MRSDIHQVKVGFYHVMRVASGGFRVVHTWLGIDIGTWPTEAQAIREARKSTEEDYLVRMLGKDDALRVIQRRNGFHGG